jgi:methyltransferase
VVSALDIGRGVVGLVAAERGVELWISSRNTRRILARGGVEAGRGHYPAMVAFHAMFLAACALEPWLLPAPDWPAAASIAGLALVLAAQALRWWAVAALGERWSTRIVVLPGAPPVVTGPYRWLRHPNYLAVAVEIVALPLAAGAWRTAIAASAGNALLLAVRIRAEERALGRAWGEAFGGKPRFVPGAAAIGAGPSGRGSGTGTGGIA